MQGESSVVQRHNDQKGGCPVHTRTACAIVAKGLCRPLNIFECRFETGSSSAKRQKPTQPTCPATACHYCTQKRMSDCILAYQQCSLIGLDESPDLLRQSMLQRDGSKEFRLWDSKEVCSTVIGQPQTPCWSGSTPAGCMSDFMIIMRGEDGRNVKHAAHCLKLHIA